MSVWTGDTNQVHNASWAFPSPSCARCGGRALDPDRLYCETCTQILGIAIAEEAGDLPTGNDTKPEDSGK
jgi:hypothetical protein